MSDTFGQAPLYNLVAATGWRIATLLELYQVINPRIFYPLPKSSMAVDADGNVMFSFYLPAARIDPDNPSMELRQLVWDQSGCSPVNDDFAPINQYPGGVKIVRFVPAGKAPIDLLTDETVDRPPGEDVFFRVDGVK